MACAWVVLELYAAAAVSDDWRVFTVSAGERLLGWSWGLGTAVAVLHWFGLLLGRDSVCMLVELGFCALFVVEEIVRFVTS